MVEKVKSEEEVMFPNVKIGDIVVKPWSFGILFEISVMLEKVLDKINEKQILLDPTASFVSYFDMLRIFTMANQEVRKIIAITVEKSEEEINKLSMEDGIKIAMAIYEMNSSVLKNVLSSLFGTPTVGGAETKEEPDSKE